ncbi:Ssb-c31ap [Blomia tropicalis]|nr:Ssb-c31ap [Blomia tropicalis]
MSKTNYNKLDSEMKDSVKLSKNRYLTVSTFKNKVRVDIREYYVADNGKRRPGKKGISLSLDEWGKLKDNMDTIQTKIEEAQRRFRLTIHNLLKKCKLAAKTMSRLISLIASENLFSKSELPITIDA